MGAAGANGGGASYQPVITSYDYDAPVSEGGGHGCGHDGDKSDAIRRISSYYNPGPPPPPAGEEQLEERLVVLLVERLVARREVFLKERQVE